MQGPSLTPQEAVTSVARRVRRLEARGVGRDNALRLVSAELGIDLEKVRWSVDRASLGPNARIASADRDRATRRLGGRHDQIARRPKEDTATTLSQPRRPRARRHAALSMAA
jgi:hypothetical protein